MGVGMKTLSVDLRERILASYDEGMGSRQEVAHRYRVSLGMVKKLLSQRRKTGRIEPRHCYSGRKPFFTTTHRDQMQLLIEKQPDITLEEIRDSMQLNCSLPAIHYVLKEMKLSFKKNASRQRARARRC